MDWMDVSTYTYVMYLYMIYAIDIPFDYWFKAKLN